MALIRQTQSSQGVRIRISDSMKEVYSDLYMVFVDEIYMLGLGVFGGGALQLQSLTGARNKAFGGLDMILCGDFNQIEPVGKSIYAAPDRNNRREIHESNIWYENINTDIELSEHNRCNLQN